MFFKNFRFLIAVCKGRKALTTFGEEELPEKVYASIVSSGGWSIKCKEDKIACKIQIIISAISSFIVTVSVRVPLLTNIYPFNSHPFVIRKINHKV